LIETAKDAIDNVTYNEDKSLAENEALVDNILTKLADDLAAQREADSKPAEDDGCSIFDMLVECIKWLICFIQWLIAFICSLFS
jgi:hypothetical protein